MNPQLVSSATVNNLILSTIVFATILSALFLGIYSGYVAVSGILRAMNRKQVPVCSDCHRKIHRGEYDGLKLSNLAYLPC